jgi:CheY-like chemotaxis protein
MIAAPPSLGHATRRILIVDDDRFINQSLARKFTRAGCTATSAYDGREALEELGRNQFDGVLLDLKMPIEDGYAVLAKRKATPNAATPIYVLTTVGQDEELARARELGAKEVFFKSETSPAKVVGTICAAVGAHE